MQFGSVFFAGYRRHDDGTGGRECDQGGTGGAFSKWPMEDGRKSLSAQEFGNGRNGTETGRPCVSLRWRETVNPKDLALCRFCVLVFSRCYPVIHLECFVKVAVIAVAKHGSKLFYGESCVF